MAGMDVFKANAFSMMTLTDAINMMDYRPGFLGSLGIFRPVPSRTTVVAVEQRNDTLGLVPTTQRGGPATQRNFGAREVRNFNTLRLKETDKLYAHELSPLRAFGSETELEAVATEVARRQELLTEDVELTKEHHRLGAVQGIVTDADGSTLIDYFSEFGISQPSEIAFDLANTTDLNALKKRVADNVTRPIRRNSKGLVRESDLIIGLCGDAFFDELESSPVISEIIKRSPRALELLQSAVFGMIDFAGVRWVNYRGTDDNSTVAIDTDKVKFFPASPRVFEVAWGPGETMESVGAPGRALMSRIIPDLMRDEWAEIEVASYPLYVCKRPQVLLRGKRGA